ncbi:MAG TPA: T9SS type A sorting domain-containing protein [Bacteroidota bacterium]|nr:T9SS type A sorting domain-containing protein [Bacteroidota bacterium]
MKGIALVLLLALAVMAPAPARAQIPNAGFETWANGLPTGWITTNAPPIAVPVTQTSTKHTGSSALMGTVVSLLGTSSYPPYIWTEFPVAQRFSTFTGWYTFSAVGGDSLYGWLVMYKSQSPIAYAFFSNKTTRTSYTQFSQVINYFGSGVPDSCAMYFGITGSAANNDTIHVGSTFNLDDLALSGTATGVAVQPSQPVTFALSQNFPNPFNPSTLIQYQLPGDGPVRLAVFDILGREVATLVDGVQQQGTHEVRFDGGGLSSGVYFYRLQTSGSVQQRKMILQK